MSLPGRVSAFFLAALAISLVGFSIAIYVLASEHLSRQVDERLDASLNSLAAAAETEPYGLTWEPHEREHGLGRDAPPDGIQWMVVDEDGELVDRSKNAMPMELMPSAGVRRFLANEAPWRAKTKELTHHSANEPIPDSLSRERVFESLHFVAVAPLQPVESTLRTLLVTLALLSLALWVGASLLGHWISRRILAPLTTMAAAATEADADDSSAQLPVPKTGDELERLATAFNGLLQRLHDALTRQRQFAGSASHQLRTPLAGLISQVDVALRRDRTPEEYQRALRSARLSAEELRQIIESLLFLARPGSESSSLALVPLDLARWLPEHMAQVPARARSADIAFNIECDGPLLIAAHPQLLSQLVETLIENALKYSSPGTAIEIALRSEGDLVVLEVRDRGYGIAAADVPRIFQPFFRSPDAVRRGDSGVGLGLAIALRIAEAFGGTIRVESDLGAGSRFQVVFPRGPFELVGTTRAIEASPT